MRFQCCVSNPQWKERFNFKVTFFCQTVWLFLSLCKCDIVNANLPKVLSAPFLWHYFPMRWNWLFIEKFSLMPCCWFFLKVRFECLTLGRIRGDLIPPGHLWARWWRWMVEMSPMYIVLISEFKSKGDKTLECLVHGAWYPSCCHNL